jgi:hypothetical protein
MGAAMTGQFLGRAAVESAGRLLHIAGELAGLYRATVLSLIGKPVDAALLREARNRKSPMTRSARYSAASAELRGFVSSKLSGCTFYS